MRTLTLLVLLLDVLSTLQGQQATLPITMPLSSTDAREIIRIDHNAYLQEAMLSGRRSALTVQFPVHGTETTFIASPNEVLGDESARNYPDIFTYDLRHTVDGGVTGALTLTPGGIYATLFHMDKMISIYPENYRQGNSHIIEYGFQADLPRLKQFCGHDHSHEMMVRPQIHKNESSRFSDITIGANRYNYRLAIVTTGEFYQKNGNNDSQVNAVIISTVNAISAIFNNEMSFRISIGSRIFLYRDPTTDPFIPDEAGGEGRTVQAGKVVPVHFNSSSYDIGHVFHQHEDGDGWGNGGIAQLQSVCNGFVSPAGQIAKASGWSGAYTNQGNGWVNLATHEFGHQFGANHTFNGIGGSCTDAISANNAFEIGSGTTIMSYNGICDAAQNIPSGDAADNYFHVNSLDEMYQYVYNGQGGSCGSPFTASNPLPSVNANPCNADYFLPKGTPFYLKAEGSFTDGDIHTYCWEQIDEDGPNVTPTQGFIGSQAGNSTVAPLFRSYPPSVSPERYFPDLSVLTGAGSSEFEALPRVPRNMKFNVAIRDNNVTGGAVANDDIRITVLNSGPFTIIRPAGGETFQAGQSELMTWSTNGSSGFCEFLRIKLSVDGGKTFPIVLAENVPYVSGGFGYNVPVNFVKTSAARILMECMDFECFRFFNVSAANFSINSTCVAEKSVLCPTSTVVQEEGTPGLNLSMTKVVGERIFTISRPVTESLPTGNVAVKGVGNVGCEAVSTNYYYNKVNIYVTETGLYNFNIGGDGFVSLFRSNFNASAACNSFVTSSATSTGNNSITRSSTMSAQLTQCTEYVLVFYSYANLPVDVSFTVKDGPGIVIEKNQSPSPLYQHIYLLVNDDTDIISYAGQSTDFRTTPVGKYTLYSVILDKNTSLSTLPGKTFASIKNTVCLNTGLNSRKIEITSTCKIESISLSTQGACVPGTNFYTQELLVTYSKPPATGTLKINGQDFAITQSPQTITLIDLNSDGQPVNLIAFFTDAPNCKFEQPAFFTAPPNCCPAMVELGPDQSKCVGETATLNAGTTGASYKWFKNNIEIAGQTQNTLAVTTSGSYEVEVIHASGCSRRDQIDMVFNDLPTVVMPPALQYCEGETLSLLPVVQGGLSYQWLRNGVVLAGETSVSLQVSQPGTYKVRVTGVGGCQNESDAVVTEVKAPVVELGADKQKCEGESQILDAGGDGSTYEWYKDNVLISGAAGRTYQVLQSGIYRVIVTNTNLCRTEDVVKVNFFSSPVVMDFSPLINVCQGDSVTLTAVASDYQTLQWYYDNNTITGSTGTTLIVKNSGNYAVEAINLAGCKTRKSTQIEVRSYPVVDLGTDRVACIGFPVTLSAGSEGTSYQWKRNNVLLTENQNMLTVSTDGTYQVTVNNQYNCSVTDEVSVTFIAGPSVTLNGDKTICEGTNHIIMATTNAMNPEIRWFKNGELLSGQNGLSLNVSQQGTYEIVVKGGTPACEVFRSVTITVEPRPAFNLGNDRSICAGDAFPVLNGGADNTSWQWTFNGAPLASTQTVTADKTGTYAVVVKNAFDCSRTEQVTITIEALPTLVMEDQYNLCEGTTLNITPETNATVFAWKKNNILLPNETGKVLRVNSAGSYTFTATNAASCKKEKTFMVVLRAIPVVELGNAFSLCPDESRTLQAGNHSLYQWSDSSTGAALTLNAGKPDMTKTTVYAVTVTNEFGCVKSDSVAVTLNRAVKANIVADKPGVCNGEPVKLSASGGVNYTWTDPPGNSLSVKDQAVTIASPTQTTTYTVEVSDNVCPNNKDVKTIEINVFEPVNISAGPDTCVVIGRTIKLNAVGGVSYSWDNTDVIIGASNIANPVVQPIVETVFSVTITDIHGCEFTDDVTVCVREDLFKAVSVITPNGDGKNDELYFGGLKDFPDNTLRIFNRWGNLIFEAEGYQSHGDMFTGYRNGERLPADTYYYILTFDGKVIKSALTILWD